MSKQVHVSHASCDHDKTPAARAKCRRIRRGGAPETPKAEIVARVKGKKSNKRSKKDVTYRDLVTEIEADMSDDELLKVQAEINEDAVAACAKDEPAQVQVNVIAKGSKVVHTSAYDEDGEMMFACTKRPVNVDTATITTNDVTCKNCLKLSNK